MRVALITDTHFGVRSDSPIFLDYQEDFYKNIFFPKIKEENCQAVIHLGDLWDRRKYINYVTLKRAKEFFFTPLNELNIPSYLIVGNHDTTFKNTNDVNSLELLLPPGEYKNLNLITYPQEIDIGGKYPVAMVPWIATEDVEDSINFLYAIKSSIGFGHMEINGFPMYKGVENHEGLDRSILQKFEMFFSGHFHHRSTDGRVYYLGCPYEMTWQDFGDPKGFHIFDLSTKSLEFYENPLKMFHKIYYDDLNKSSIDVLNFYSDVQLEKLRNRYVKIIIQNKTNVRLFDKFIEKVEGFFPADLQSVDDNLNFIFGEEDESTVQSEDLMTIFKSYIEQLDLSVSKKDIENLFQDLYSEATNL